MRNVMYHFTAQIAILIPRLEGLLLPTRRGDMPFFDDNQSFILAIRSAEISITTDAMANVLNQHVFAADDSPLKEITITSQGNSLNLRGKVHSKGDVSFETEGTLSVNDTGEIRIHSDRIRAAHLPVKGLMDLLGVKIASLINTNKVEGVRVDRNDLIVNPEQILPPPRIRGRLTAVQLRGNEIVLYFGAKAVASSKQPFQNYMAFHGARLKFGKLTMNDTDMVLIDMDTRDPFDFYLHHYKEQLVAGLYQDDAGLRLTRFHARL